MLELLNALIDLWAERQAELQIRTLQRDRALAILKDIRDGVYTTDRTIRPHAVPLNRCDNLKGLMAEIDQLISEVEDVL